MRDNWSILLYVWGSLYDCQCCHMLQLNTYLCLLLCLLTHCSVLDGAAPSTATCFYVSGFLVSLLNGTFICVQHVSSLLNHVEFLLLHCLNPLCSKTSFSSGWKDVGVFTISALGNWEKKPLGDIYLFPNQHIFSFPYSWIICSLSFFSTFLALANKNYFLWNFEKC